MILKKHRIYHFLLNYPNKTILQKEISNYCKVTPEYCSKIIKKLKKKKVIIKENKNTVKLINPLMLIFLLNFEEKEIKPLLFKTPSFKDTISILNRTIYSLTGESAIQIKEGKKVKKMDVLLLGKDLELIEKNFQRVRKNANLKIYIKDHFSFLNQYYKNDIALTSDAEITLFLLYQGKLKEAISFFLKNLF